MIKRINLNQTNRPIDTVKWWRDTGRMLLSPPYQRGDVWGTIRRQNFIKSVLLGIPIPSLIINDRTYGNWGDEITCAVIDGKQRITTLLMFFDGLLKVPGEWFGQSGEVSYQDLSEVQQRRFSNIPIPFSEGGLSSEEEEREVFELVNFGGVPQGEMDMP
jgi:uncharacterized protein with ParB-like and HNH nuclease domain